MPSQLKMKQETSLSVVQLEITFGFIATKFHHVTCHTKLHIVFYSVTNNDEHLRSASQNHCLEREIQNEFSVRFCDWPGRLNLARVDVLDMGFRSFAAGPQSLNRCLSSSSPRAKIIG